MDLEVSGRCPGVRKEREWTGLWSEERGPKDTHLVWAVFLPCPRTRRRVPLFVPSPTPTIKTILPLMVSPP